MHFASRTFSARHYSALTFANGAGSVSTTTVATTWTAGGAAFAAQSLDYIVKAADNAVIANGTATTSSGGVLTVTIPIAYSGLVVMVKVENVGSDMVTAGKFHGAQVVTAA